MGAAGCGGGTSADAGRTDGGAHDAEVEDASVRPDGAPRIDAGQRDGGSDPCDGMDCSALDDACNVGVCDPETGACDAVPVANGTSCDDGDSCTTDDQCTDGACGGADVDCSALTNACNTGTCNAADGSCVAMPLTGPSCDDGDACTSGDVCSAGACAGTDVDCSGLDTQCRVGTCDPTSGSCGTVDVLDGIGCDDGNPCTTGDACGGGECIGATVDCSGSSDACNTGACDPATGACVPVPVSDGTSCDDGIACTTADVCTAGVCGGSRPVRFDFETGVAHEWTFAGGSRGWATAPSRGRGGSAALANEDISDGQSAHTQLDGFFPAAGAITFWRATSTERGFDFLRFSIDGVEQAAWSGDTALNRVSFPVSAGAHVFEWRYTKDSSISSGADTVYIDDVELIGGVARTSFERGVPASFVMGGTTGWISSTTASSGTRAMQNGDIADNQTSSASVQISVPANGRVSFFRRVSSESGWDFLRFFVDGVERERVSGDRPYTQTGFPLTPGPHTLEWRYTKDGSVSSFLDTAFVDDIDLGFDSCAVTPTFPTAAANICRPSGCTTLGAIGGTRYFESGSYLEEGVRFEGVRGLSNLLLQLQMNDQTTGCAAGATHTFDVAVNGTTVGSYSITTPASGANGTINVARNLAFAPITGTGATRDQYTIRLTATSTVCAGGDSWMWVPGGSAIGL